MKRLILILALVSLMILSACRAGVTQPTPTATSLPASPTSIPPTPTPEPSPTPVPAPTALLTVAPVSLELSGALYADQFSMTSPVSLGQLIFAVQPGAPFDPNIPASLNGLPPHLMVFFENQPSDPLMFRPDQPQGRILPVQAYLAMYAQAGQPEVQKRIEALKALLATRPAQVEGELHVLPGINALQVLKGRIHYLDLPNAAGVAFLAHYSQGQVPVTNRDLIYIFQGLSNDGMQYLSFVFPVTSPVLPDSLEQVLPETQQALQADPAAYYASVAQALEEADSTEFQPSLVDLDISLLSIRLGGTPADQPTQPTVTPTSSSPLPPAPPITGVIWEWQSLVKLDGKTNPVSDPDNYTIEFLSDGSYRILADCNSGSGTYKTNGTLIDIQAPSLTRKACPSGSQDSEFVSLLKSATAYDVKNGKLSLYTTSGSMLLGPRGSAYADFLAGPWYWISTTDPLNNKISPSDPDRYSLQLAPDGKASVKADCNTASGKYQAKNGVISIDLTSGSDETCPEGSLSKAFLDYLEKTTSYALEDNRLVLTLADGSVMRFTR